MPTYEYACPKCGIVEVFQSIKEDALKKCPQCKTSKVQRMLSVGAGIIFKGSGFWETDYNRSAEYQKKSKEESSGESKESSDPVPQTKNQTQTKRSDPGSDPGAGTKSPSPAGSTDCAAAPAKPAKPASPSTPK